LRRITTWWLGIGLLALGPVVGCGRTKPGEGTGKVPTHADHEAVVDSLREPTVDDAVAVVRAYYNAINHRRYPDAYVLWSGRGETSGQTAESFATGFARTDSVRVDIGTPSDIGAAAGSRYITIPVRLLAYESGSTETFAGTYTLRRSVVDGSTADQRQWRIAGADIRKSR
jgi:hypothetical protein